MSDPNAIEEENVAMRQTLERVAFMVAGASCKDPNCMHSTCSVVRTLEHNLKAFMDRKRPHEVVSYQARILELENRLGAIRKVSSLP